jgi:NTE family protein
MKAHVLNLALQGGGSYGAFTWGVLDRLLEDERIELDGLSGASAGAMNAAVLAYGFTTGGRLGARQALRRFWESVAASAPVASFAFLWRFASPYQLNPLNRNPLRELLTSQIDFARLRAECSLKLFIGATSVRTGMARVFRTREITADVLLASACVPALHHSVMIDGEAYWDGGLTANPPIRPLVYESDARDILVVLLQPGPRPEVPRTAEGIQSRLGEIGLSATLFSELDGIALAKREAERGAFALGSLERRLRRLQLHFVCPPPAVSQMSMLSRLNTEALFIEKLHDEGRNQADAWLAEQLPPAAGDIAFAPALPFAAKRAG